MHVGLSVLPKVAESLRHYSCLCLRPYVAAACLPATRRPEQAVAAAPGAALLCARTELCLLAARSCRWAWCAPGSMPPWRSTPWKALQAPRPRCPVPLHAATARTRRAAGAPAAPRVAPGRAARPARRLPSRKRRARVVLRAPLLQSRTAAGGLGTLTAWPPQAAERPVQSWGRRSCSGCGSSRSCTQTRRTGNLSIWAALVGRRAVPTGKEAGLP